LSTALHNVKNGLTHLTFYYDETDEIGDQLSHVIKLDAVEHVEVDDTYYTLRDLEVRGFQTLRLLKEPGWFKQKWFRFKWWLKDRKVGK
jgi:hypothetical protein